MSVLLVRFNIILAILLLASGCATTEEKAKKADAKKKAKEGTMMSIHMETNLDGTRHTTSVPVYRAKPMLVPIETEPFLDPGYMLKAEIVTVDEHGGFAIKLYFDQTGSTRLANATTANKGRRLVVAARWDDFRWLAAPRIMRPITDGTFIFTPDASREESERLVNGLNNVIKKVRKPYVF